MIGLKLSTLHEVTPSLYGFVNEQDATNAKKNVLVGGVRIILCLQ